MGELNILRKAPNEPLSRLSTFFLVCLLAVVAILAYWPSVAALWTYWIDQPYLGGHGPLVAALAVWLLIRARSRIDTTAVRPAPWALLLLIPCSLAALVFWRAGIQTLQLLMLPALIWLGVLTAFGTAMARVTAMPIGYLYFAMPAWNLLTVPLQQLTVQMVALLAPAIGLPATVSGSEVSFPNGGHFVVTVACSGVGFLTEALAVAALVGELEAAHIGRRLRLLGSMTLIALATNWLRVLLLLLIGYRAGMNNVIVAHDHLEFGYVLFVIVLVAFVWFATRGPSPDPEVRSPGRGRPRLGAYLGAVAVLIVGPLLTSFSTPSAVIASKLQLPPGQNSWQGPISPADEEWHPVFVGAHAQQQGAYQDADGRTVEAVAVGYVTQEQGRELVNEGNSILGDGGLSAESIAFVDAGDTTYVEMEAIGREGKHSLIWSVYDIGGTTFVVPLLSQLWYGVRALTAPPYSAQLAFRASCELSCDSARGTLRSFVQGMGPQLLTVANPSRSQTAIVPSVRPANPGRSEAP